MTMASARNLRNGFAIGCSGEMERATIKRERESTHTHKTRRREIKRDGISQRSLRAKGVCPASAVC